MSKQDPVRDPMFPVTWSEWDPMDTLMVELYNVVFLSDFGEFKEGEELDNLTVDYGKGHLATYDDNGDVARKQRFIAVPEVK